LVSAETLLFDALATAAVFSALSMVVVARTAVAVATALLACLAALSGVLVLLGAELVGIVQLLVQAGAVTVLLLMIFMLVGAEDETPSAVGRAGTTLRLIGCLAAAGLAVAVIGVAPVEAPMTAALDPASSGHRPMGLALFRHHALALQILSLLLLSAVVGSMTLALRRKT
jgi:NADH:ubiquinone oxidoreductase subunit 6 (subunit J)